jgi:hypothetical protein
MIVSFVNALKRRNYMLCYTHTARRDTFLFSRRHTGMQNTSFSVCMCVCVCVCGCKCTVFPASHGYAEHIILSVLK